MVTNPSLTINIGANGAAKTAKEVAAIQSAIAGVDKEAKDASDSAKKLAKELNLNPQQTEQLAQALLGAKKSTQEAANAAGDYKSSLDRAKGSVNNLTNEASKGLDEVSGKTRNLSGLLQGLTQGLGQSLANAGIGALQSAVGGVVGVVQNAVGEFASFDQALTEFTAKAGDAAFSLEGLKDESIRLAATTSQTPATVAETATALLALGVAAGDVESSLSGVINLSDVLGENPVLTGQVLQTAVNVFGELGETTDTAADKINRLINTTAAGATSGINEFLQLFSQAGGAARLAGLDFDQLSAAFATLRNTGQPAEVAATGLRTVIASLTAPAGAGAKVLERINFNLEEFRDEAGQLDLTSLVNQFKGLSTEELFQVFGREGVGAITGLINSIDTTYQTTLDNVRNASGSTAESLELINQSLSRQALLLEGQVSGALTLLGEAIGPTAFAGLQFLSNLLAEVQAQSVGFDGLAIAGERLKEALENNPELVERLGQALAAIGDGLVNIVALGIDTLAGAIENFDGSSSIFDNFIAIIQSSFSILQTAITAVIEFGSVLLAVLTPVIDVFFAVQAGIFQIRDAIFSGLLDIAKAAKDVFSSLFGVVDTSPLEGFTDVIGVAAGIISDFVTTVSGLAVSAINTFSNILTENSEIVESFQGIINNLADILQSIGEIIFTVVVGAFKALGNVFSLSSEGANQLLPILGGITQAVLQLANLILGAVARALGAAVDLISSIVNRLISFQETILNIRRDIEQTSAILPGAANGIAAASNAFEGFKTALDDTEESAGEASETIEEVGETARDTSELLGELNKEFKDRSDDLTKAYAETELALLQQGATEEELAQARRENLEQTIALEQERAAALRALAEDPDLSADDRQSALQQAAQAELTALNQRIQLQRQINQEEENARRARIQAINDELNVSRQVADIRRAINTQEIDSLRQQQSQLTVNSNLENALLNLDRARLTTALAIAESAGDEVEQARIQEALFENRLAQIDAEYETRLQTLDIAEQLALAQIEQQRIATEISIIEAEVAVAIAQQNNATQEQISALQQVVSLRRQAASTLDDAVSATEESFSLQRDQAQAEALSNEEALRAERIRAETAANREQTEERSTESLESQTGEMESQAELSQRIADAEQRRANLLLSALTTQKKSSEEALKQLDLVRQNLKEAQEAGLFSDLGPELENAADELERILKRGGSTADLVKFAQENDEAIARQLLEAVGRGDILGLLEADEAISEGTNEGADALAQGVVSGAEQGADILASAIRGAFGGAPQGRFKGGPVSAGEPYIVGEKGPELIFPTRSGYVATARQTAQLLSQMGPLNVNVPSRTNPVEKKLDTLINEVKKGRKVSPNSVYNISTPTPMQDTMALKIAEIKALARTSGL